MLSFLLQWKAAASYFALDALRLSRAPRKPNRNLQILVTQILGYWTTSGIKEDSRVKKPFNPVSVVCVDIKKVESRGVSQVIWSYKGAGGKRVTAT